MIQRIQQAGLRYCPHYLGAGIGLLASAHVFAAAGGDGWLEVDANPNPLRTTLAPQIARPRSGVVELGSEPGIGVVPDMDRLRALCVPAGA